MTFMVYLTMKSTVKQYRFDYKVSKAYLRNDRELWYQQSLTSLCTIEWIPPAIYRLLGALWRHCHYDVIMTSQCHAGTPATGTYSWITFVTLWHSPLPKLIMPSWFMEWKRTFFLLGVRTIVRTHYPICLATGTTSTYYYFQENGQNLSNYNWN